MTVDRNGEWGDRGLGETVERQQKDWPGGEAGAAQTAGGEDALDSDSRQRHEVKLGQETLKGGFGRPGQWKGEAGEDNGKNRVRQDRAWWGRGLATGREGHSEKRTVNEYSVKQGPGRSDWKGEGRPWDCSEMTFEQIERTGNSGRQWQELLGQEVTACLGTEWDS